MMRWSRRISGKKMLCNEKGSTMLVALFLLALLTVGSVTATNMSLTESYIVRNTGIALQNEEMAEAAAGEAVRWILDQSNPALLVPGGGISWIQSDLTFNQNPDQMVLTNANSAIPTQTAVVNGNSTPTAAAAIIAQRGETAANPLRYYFVGWQTAPGNSLKVTSPRWRSGKVVAIYKSATYGSVTIAMGIRKKF